MKQLLTLVFTLILFSVSAQNFPDALLGKWENEDATVRFDFFKTGSMYNAKIIWLANPLAENGQQKLDKNNPDKTLRNRPIVGLTILTGLQFSVNNNMWIGGKIYSPEKGEAVACKIKLTNKNALSLIASKGIFSVTKKWKRYDK
ncbi:DUF2147 domain-containing protein [Parasediminibacterium paludis]|uniref:DUF2147 domain-containing protein n=1 Tax=Parasediminibacterium paludis TaxID=908966 RepID=A0ABV8PYQ7_9BACT